MTEKDRKEFKEYLRNCTDRQVYGVLEKEKAPAGKNTLNWHKMNWNVAA